MSDPFSSPSFHGPNLAWESQPVVLVTGGSGVIGGAVCRRFGLAGCAVAVQYCRHPYRAELIAADMQTRGGQAVTIHADLRQYGSASRMVQTVLDRFGRLDIVICAAGQAESHLLLRTSLQSWDAHLAVNLTGTFYTLKAVASHFYDRRDGAAILIGSLSGQQGRAGQAAYSASKAGLWGLLRAIAKEWGPYNVRINAVFPGWHDSPLSSRGMPDASQCDDHVLKRSPNLHDVANIVYELAWMRDVSGQVWNLDSRIW